MTKEQLKESRKIYILNLNPIRSKEVLRDLINY